MRRLVIDLDNTLTVPEPEVSYAAMKPDVAMVAKLREYQVEGFEIIIQTARNMRTYENSIGKINAHTLPVIIDWLRRHNVPFDEVHVGKPWCGLDGFYVDDRAIRPSEFLCLSLKEIHALLQPKS